MSNVVWHTTSLVFKAGTIVLCQLCLVTLIQLILSWSQVTSSMLIIESYDIRAEVLQLNRFTFHSES